VLPTILIYGVILAVFYAVLLLPQQRRQKAKKELLNALQVGDEVLLTSGIHGFVSELDGAIAWVEVAPNVDLKVSRSAIEARLVDESPSEKES
jgi:preprotein translocase subunit YajC